MNEIMYIYSTTFEKQKKLIYLKLTKTNLRYL